jgi:flagellar biogenesis protein FliO
MALLDRLFIAGGTSVVRNTIAASLMAALLVSSPVWGDAEPTSAPTSIPTTASEHATSVPAASAPVRPTTLPATEELPAWNWKDLAGDKSDEGPTDILMRMLAYVLIILVVGGIGLVVVKRLMPRLSARTGRKVSLVETVYLGPRKAVHLLEVEGRRFLVGSTKDGVSMLAEVSPSFSTVLEAQQGGSSAAPRQAEQTDVSPQTDDGP